MLYFKVREPVVFKESPACEKVSRPLALGFGPWLPKGMIQLLDYGVI